MKNKLVFQVGSFTVLTGVVGIGVWYIFYKKKVQIRKGVKELIGNTPLIKIESLSQATGCEIFGKAEFLNPGGSIKDRVALQIIEEALSSGDLAEGGLVCEGTAGSTGISIAMIAAGSGLRSFVALPDDAADEKAQILSSYGAEVMKVRPVSITHPDHFVNVAQRRAKKEQGAIFANQFENLANFRAHLKTGEEIWNQSGGNLDAFICGAGTGGTIAGVSNYLKKKNTNIQIYLIDPPGSGLFNKVTRGVMYTQQEAEGKRLKNPFDTITEGIGINRITENFRIAQIDSAFRGSDAEAVLMSKWLLEKDGLFLGSSAAMNCVGAIKVAKKLGPGHKIVTVLCDGGQRHLSKFHNQEYLKEQGLFFQCTPQDLSFVT